MENLGEFLGYIAKPCSRCGRMRVEEYSGGKHICEKCNWCEEDKAYFNWKEYYCNCGEEDWYL